MTALCGGGSSQPIVSIPSTYLWGVSALLNLVTDGGWGWLQEALALVGAINLDLPSFCSTDPPAQPTFTIPELEALFTVQPSTDFQSGLGKLKDLVLNLSWHQLCECSTGPQPVLPQPQSPPIGTTTPSQATSCGNIAIPPTAVPLNTIVNLIGNFKNSDGSNNASRSGVAPPAGVQSVQLQLNTLDAPNGHQPPDGGDQLINDWTVAFEDAAHTLLASHNMQNYPPNNPQFAFPVPGGTTQFHLWVGPDALDGLIHHVSAAVTFLCSASGGQQSTAGCCPPDPSILSLLSTINQAVTLIQRYKAPFAFVSGAAHSGAIGTSSTPIPKCIGIDLVVTASPPNTVFSPGNPPYAFDWGWMSVSEVGGMLQEKRIAQQHFTWLPTDCQLADHFNLFLKPGVTVTWTELYAES